MIRINEKFAITISTVAIVGVGACIYFTDSGNDKYNTKYSISDQVHNELMVEPLPDEIIEMSSFLLPVYGNEITSTEHITLFDSEAINSHPGESINAVREYQSISGSQTRFQGYRLPLK